jgi:hypothetical protein
MQSKVSAWRPLNVEFEPEAEDDVDDTQEIQIEEALKLYQIALKHHSEGAPSFDKTAAAYHDLFNSDIFKYTESLSEYQRHEIFGESLVFDSVLEDDFDAGPAQAAGAADSAPNTLPQILHLSYKNHGQFLLERMQHYVTQHGAVPQTEGWNNIRGALNYFAEALDKEDTDLDLWLRAASVSAMLGSKRLTRYCLEAVLDGNDELWENLLRLPGLEEGFAGQQLRELVEKLEDHVSLLQAPLSLMKRKKLSQTVKKRLNPYPFAPLPADVAHANVRPVTTRPLERVSLTPAKWNWAGVGEAILQQYLAEARGMAQDMASGASLSFNIPPDSASLERNEAITESEEIAPPASSESPTPPQITDPDPVAPVSGPLDDKTTESVVMDEEEPTVEAGEQINASAPPLDPLPSLSRKRSTDSAGLPETADGGRSRSKRIRARDTVTEPSAGGDRAMQDGNKQWEELLEPYTHADQCLYEIVKDIYTRLGVDGIQQPKHLRDLVSAGHGPTPTDPFDSAVLDMIAALQSGNGTAAQVLLSSQSFELVGATRDAGLSAFLGYSKTSTGEACNKPPMEAQMLGAFTKSVHEAWLSTEEVAFAWLEALLSRGFFTADEPSSSYMHTKWPEDLKRNLVQIIVNVDEYVYERMLQRISDLNARMLSAHAQHQAYEMSAFDASQVEMVENLFELHLDIYSLIKHPHSQVDQTTQTLQSDRLERWSTVARDAMQLRSACELHPGSDDLALRHIWATVFQLSVDDEIPPEHVLSALGELKDIFGALENRTIHIQNNAVMPELCVAAVDRELVRISMKDFFLKVFDDDEKDPVTVIESLEPILEVTQEVDSSAESPASGVGQMDGVGSSLSDLCHTTDRPSPILEMRRFLDAANINVRSSLWHRLREAYEAIDYTPKVLSCHLRSIETLVTDFKSTHFLELSSENRQVKILTRLRVIDELVVKITQIIKADKSAFDCLSYEHVRSSMAAIAQLLSIFSAADMFRDLVRIGHYAMPRGETLPNQTFMTMSVKLDDMHLRLWVVQYYLLREGLSQNAEGFPTPSEDLFEFIRHVHYATGVRHYCHTSGRQFLRLAKTEVLRMDDVVHAISREAELCQILHDLYGLKLFVQPLDCQNFMSIPENLDKKIALSIIPFVISQAGKVDLKDLPKTELRGAIEKVHQALGKPKQSKDIAFNQKLITAYYRSPINPVSLFNCLKGVGSLSIKYLPAEEAVAASLGWYYLIGNISFSKFRSQKRLPQGPTEDLNYAQAFFLQDLEYSVDRWQTWYRLAQAYDLQLEEAVSWNADKLNSNTVDITNYQRYAIHCYAMAVACAVRDADPSLRTRDQVSQLYTDFGNRIYASSREPFNMEAFQFRETEKKYYNNDAGTAKREAFPPLIEFTAWKFAATLFKRAIKGNTDKWWNHYMLGKCLWKMWKANVNETRANAVSGIPIPVERSGHTYHEVCDAFISAIETLPSKKGRNGEPILEPHYKLVAIVHKLFRRKAFDYIEGVELLGHTSYSRNVTKPEGEQDWKRYILAILKTLRSADKASWHHRIIARSAMVIYEDDWNDPALANDAKHELTQQMFTKTMTVQVWKPEHERPGRHFVYTSLYTTLFVHILDLTEDKINLEALAKRVRKKTPDFYEHSKLWHGICSRYLNMLRRIGRVPEGQEDSAFKSIQQDEFNALAMRLESWCQNPATQHPVLDVLRDAIEFKRLNAGLMKPASIDDLIADSYALLYTTICPTLPPLPSEQPQLPAPTSQYAPPTHPHKTPGALPISSLMQADGPGELNNSAPSAVYHPNQLVSQLPQPEPVAKPRPKNISRKEMIRKAETCVQKTAALQSTAMPIRSPPTLNANLPSFATRTSSPEKSGHPETNRNNFSHNLETHYDKSGSATAAASVSNDDAEPERSAPTSVHDDADDESELSEMDESEVQEIEQAVIALRRSAPIAATKPPKFPNLVTNRASADPAAMPDGRVGRGGVGDTIRVEIPGQGTVGGEGRGSTEVGEKA